MYDVLTASLQAESGGYGGEYSDDDFQDFTPDVGFFHDFLIYDL